MNILNGGKTVDFIAVVGHTTTATQTQLLVTNPLTLEEMERDRVMVQEWNRQRNAEWEKYLETIRAKTDAELVKDAEDENNVDYDAGGPSTDELIRRFKIYAGAML